MKGGSMTKQTLEWVAVMQRLDRLEREGRWWKAVASALCGLLGLLLLAGATGERGARIFDEVRAEQFVLVDAKGTPRAGLRVGADGSTALALADPEGKPVAGLSVLPDGSPRLRFYDKEGKARGGLGVQHDGAVGLALADKDGTLHLWTGMTELHQISLTKGQRIWRSITTLNSGPASPEDYRPADAELLSRTEGGPR
jgi:hypothetical protein